MPASRPTLVLLVALTACSSSPRTLSFLPEASEIDTIELDDIVRGPDSSRLFPMEARYVLRREGGRFAGSASFSVGSRSPRTAARSVTLPADAVARFLDVLDDALLQDGYEPASAPPGGASPDVRIVLSGRAPTIALVTRSPGADYLPWGVETGGHTYTIVSTAPANAFAELRPYLQRDVLDALAREAIGSGSGTPAPAR